MQYSGGKQKCHSQRGWKVLFTQYERVGKQETVWIPVIEE